MKRIALNCCSLLTICLTLTFLSGCGEPPPPTGTLSGQVLLEGEPYANPAQVAIISMQTGRAASTRIGDDGEFAFEEEMVVGEYTAYLTPPAPEDAEGEQPMAVTIDQSVPDQYWNEASSPWKVTIEEGTNETTLEVE